MAKKKKAKTAAPKGRMTLKMREIRAEPNQAAMEKAQRKITKAIKDTGITVREMSVKSGVSTATARSIISGNVKDMKLATLVRVLPLLGISLP